MTLVMVLVCPLFEFPRTHIYGAFIHLLSSNNVLDIIWPAYWLITFSKGPLTLSELLTTAINK